MSRAFHLRSCARHAVAVLAVTSLALAGAVGTAEQASADTQTSNFETMSNGTLNGQDGWVSLGSAGFGCALYDHTVVTNGVAPVSFATKSLRISNAITSGCFDGTFSKKTSDEAGEPTADAGSFLSGTRRTGFTGSFDVASVLPGTAQPGLFMSVSPDRGDGARMSYVGLADAGGTWNLNFYDYQDVGPFGDGGGPLSDGCDVGDDFVQTMIATGVSSLVPHTITFKMTFVPGPRNDIVQVLLDGSLIHTGTSWEDYFRYCEATNTSRTVRSLLFRTGGTAAPGTAGNGFLVDNLSVTSGNAPGAPTITQYSSAGFTGVKVTFTPGPDNGGPITSYTASCFGVIGQPTVTATGPSSPLTVGGLISGTPYKCSVTATNAFGTSPPSNLVGPIWPGPTGGGHCPTLPTAPRTPTAASGNASATVSWAPPIGGCWAGYLVTPLLGTTPQTSQLVVGQGTTTVVKGLVNGQTYSFAISAYNGNLAGPSVSTGPVTVGTPAAVAAVTAAKVAKGSVKVAFAKPASNGAPITSYTATCKSSNGGVTKSKTGKASPLVVTGLTAKKLYRCVVRATNSRGTGSASKASVAVGV